MDSKMIDAYIVGSDAILFVYDVTKKPTFAYLDECLAIVKKLYGKKPLPLMGVIGNKTDIHHANDVKMEEHMKFCESHGMKSFFMSSKTGDQVKDCFKRIALCLAGLDNQSDEFKKILKKMDSDEFAESSDEEPKPEEDYKQLANKKTSKCNIF